MISLLAAIGLGSIIAAFITRSVAIANDRQAWINDLRKGIADYTGAAYRWFHKYHELELAGLEGDDMVSRQREELMPIVNEAQVILRRIRLRINPRDNQDKAEDDALLRSLGDLLDKSKLDAVRLAASWDQLADDAVERARRVLKREWEVTKLGPFAKIVRCRKGRV
jgi:hypothetical protein